MRRVLIGTPAHDGRVDAVYTFSLLQTLRLALDKGVDLRWLCPPGDAILPNARNEIVRDALAHSFDDLIFIDSDQDWQPEDVFRLLDYRVHCVGAPIRKKCEEELYNVRASEGPDSFVKHPIHSNLMSAPGMALGTGFLRLSRRALQLLWDKAEPYQNGNKAPARWIFEARPVLGRLVGEDTMVSMKLSNLGIQTWLDPTMHVGHMGPKRYAGDFAAWLKTITSKQAE